jgi:dienelactone hydrolase
MGLDLARLLDIRFFQAFDLDEAGRVLAGSDESGSTQLVEIQPDGTVVALTALPGPCTGRYVPGERAVLVSHDHGGNELHQLSVLRLATPPSQPASLGALEPLVRDPRYMHILGDVRDGQFCYLTNRRNGLAFDPIIRQLGDSSERTLVLGDAMFGAAAISPDGRWLALTVLSPVTANAEHVALVDLTAPPGAEHLADVTPANAPATSAALGWTPDSSALYVSANNDRQFTAVGRYDLSSGQLTWLVSDDSADLTGWLSPDGALLLVERNDDGVSRLALHDAITGAQLRELALPATSGVVTGPRWSPDSTAIALTVSGADLPSDAVLYPAVAAGRPQSPRILTQSARGLGEDPPGRPEQHRLPAPDGAQIPCLVYKPAAGSDSAVAGSAVLVVHGGPEAQARPRFIIDIQFLAAAGHTVLVPNVRGSTGYGKSWYSADDGPRRLDSVADLAAVHAYLPALGVDRSRAALWGGSYGGYMVLAGLAFQPELWAAGVDIVGIASLVTFLENTSAYRRAYREREYGTLARDREFLWSVSPLSRIDDIKAPLFIIHGANDPRVPLSEAEQIHAALISRGRECELVIYGDEGHGLARRANRADAIPRAQAFLARHLSVAPIPAPAPASAGTHAHGPEHGPLIS